jgi:hypothetical protein
MQLLVTITRYYPAIGGAEIHTRELLRNLKPPVEPRVVAHWASNRTDWLLGTTLFAPVHDSRYDDEGRSVHLIGPTLVERIQRRGWDMSWSTTSVHRTVGSTSFTTSALAVSH